MSLLTELKRRNVFRIAGIYAVVAWILIQVAGALENSLNLPAWFDSVVTAGLMIGFPIALLLAWAFEMTPEGVKKTGDLEEGVSSLSTGKMDILILIGIIAVLGLGVWQQMSPKQLDSRLRGNDGVGGGNDELLSVNNKDSVTANTSSVIPAKAGISSNELEVIQGNSIAVLPFKDLSPNGDQEYFSDGMSEEILNVLVRVKPLQVSSRTSAFKYKKSNLRIPEIAQELKVRHILEGSVRKSGETIRITAQLIDAQNDKHLWSENYDRPLTTENIFAIQDEISNAIVKALSESLGLDEVKKININKTTDNLTAYELYLKAKPLFLARNDLDIADMYLLKAIELDKNYAEAWELRAVVQFLWPEYTNTDESVEVHDQRAEQFALKAIELEPKSALAKSLLAQIMINANDASSFSNPIALFNESIEIDPNIATTYYWRGLAYSGVGMLDKAEKDYTRCLELEPSYSACYSSLTNSALMQDQERADQLILQGLHKDILNMQYFDLSWLAKQNNEILFSVVVNHKNNLAGWGRVDELYQAYLHPEKNHRKLIDDILSFSNINKSSQSNDYFSLKKILVSIGAYELKPDASIMWGFGYKSYRQSPEFKAYIFQSGIYQYWLENGFPPQCKPIGEDDFECD